VMMQGHLSGRFRHAIERMDPSWYLASSYYEHWLTAAATGLVEAGIITQADLDARLGAPFPVARPMRAPRLADPGPSVDAHRFAVGDEVRVREWHPFGHTRAPRYVQGKRGTVVRLDGIFSLPDVEYHCDHKRTEPTYSVRFEADELWGSPGDPVHVDLWDSYLEPVTE
ncbi:MAG TPA: SH3-like domain-containing protein, partial [Acidimicrobiia bacterium]|nr:SH3-like domain-containing protein [Acidimicrobiia bacterium]